jgi:hypothetical protein
MLGSCVEYFLCVGGDRNGRYWSPEFVTFPPIGYEKFRMVLGGEELEVILVHESLDEKTCLSEYWSLRVA